MRKNLIFDDTRKGLDVHIENVEKIEGNIKMCSKCRKVFSVNNFFSDKFTLDGLSNNCKKCQIEYTKNYYKQNREKHIKCSTKRYFTKRLRDGKISLKEYKKIIKDRNL